MTLRLLGIQGREPWDTKSAFAVDLHVFDISKRVFGQCCARTMYMGVYVQFTWDNLVGAKATPSMNYLFHRRLLEWLSTSNLGWAYLHVSNLDTISSDVFYQWKKWNPDMKAWRQKTGWFHALSPCTYPFFSCLTVFISTAAPLCLFVLSDVLAGGPSQIAFVPLPFGPQTGTS